MNGKLALRATLAATTLSLGGASLGATALLAAPAYAAPAKVAPAAKPLAPLSFKTVETWGFKVELPEELEDAGQLRTDGAQPNFAKWWLRSGSNNIRMQVVTKKPNLKLKFREVAKYMYGSFIKKNPKSEILRMRKFGTPAHKVAYIIAKVKKVRNTKEHEYLYLRVAVRNKFAQAFVQLGVSRDRLDQFPDIAEKLIASFNLADPASVQKTLKAKFGGKIETLNTAPVSPKKAPGKVK